MLDKFFDVILDDRVAYFLGPFIVLLPGTTLTLIAGIADEWAPGGGAPADVYMPYVTIFLWANAIGSPIIGAAVSDMWDGMMAFGFSMFPVCILLWILAMVLGYGVVTTLAAIGVVILLVAMFCALFM